MSLGKIIEANEKRYRPLAFWSWDGKLEKNRLLEQIKDMDSVGYGGFIIHARGGLLTEYMGDEWLDYVGECVREAKRYGMRVFIYDEFGWPSGFVGGKLLQNEDWLAQYFEYRESAEWENAQYVYAVTGKEYRRCHKPQNGAEKYILIDIRKNISNSDILKEEVVDAFISETHEKYYARFKEEFGMGIEGFFTDEPQYFRYATPYSDCMPEILKREYGVELFERLPELFCELGDYKSLRYAYYKALHERYIKTFIAKIQRWCIEHGCKCTGHTIEESRLFTQMWCCGGAMPFYEQEDIPCVDSLGKCVDCEITAKQVGSVASQLNKREVLTESFACSGWNVSLSELKKVCENQYVGGVNMLTPHLYHYSFTGNRKNDHPTSFSPQVPWFENSRDLNIYFGKLGALLAGSTEYADTVVIHPMHSAYQTYRRDKDDESVRELDDGFLKTVKTLCEQGIAHHFADENLLRKYGQTRNGVLTVGAANYKNVVLPDLYGLDSSTVELLEKYVSGGGRILLCGRRPDRIDGKPCGNKSDFLVSNTTLGQIKRGEKIRFCENYENVRYTLRKSKEGDFAYFTNSGDCDTLVRFDTDYVNVCGYDVMRNTYTALPNADGAYELLIDAGGSAVLYFAKVPTEALSIAGEKREIPFKPTHKTQSYCTLDRARVSSNGIAYGDELPLQGIAEGLIKRKYRGKLYLKYCFHVSDVPKNITLIYEKSHLNGMLVNGMKVPEKRGSEISDEFFSADISKAVKSGSNEIVLCVDYIQPENACDILFGEGITESLVNCFCLDTEIENVYLAGDFSVKADGVRANADGTLTACGNFSLSASDENEYGLFFAGRVTYELDTSALKAGYYEIKIDGKFAALEFYINGERIKSHASYENKCRVYIDADTRICVTAVSGNRNLLGPHHCAEHEPIGVSPRNFTMTGTWNDGASNEYVKDYSFVKFGVEKITATESAINKKNNG